MIAPQVLRPPLALSVPGPQPEARFHFQSIVSIRPSSPGAVQEVVRRPPQPLRAHWCHDRLQGDAN